MLVVVIMLFMLKLTCLPIHIILSVIGIGILAAYTVIIKKEWKLPHVETLMRVMYGIAFVTGVVVMNFHRVLAISIIHKVSAVLLIALFVYKFIQK